jgi:hypothetical protein
MKVDGISDIGQLYCFCLAMWLQSATFSEYRFASPLACKSQVSKTLFSETCDRGEHQANFGSSFFLRMHQNLSLQTTV